MLPSIQHTLAVIVLFIVQIRCQVTSVFDSSKFIGYYVAASSVEPLFAGNGWVTSGSYAGDCDNSGRCPIATKCAKNLLHYDDDTVWTCGSGASCVEATIYATSPAGLPSAVNYGCRMNWKAYTIYRALPATAEPMTTSLEAVTTAPPAPTSTETGTETGVKTVFVSVLATTAASNTTATSTTDAAIASTATSPQEPVPVLGQRKAWIAGVVVGAIFVIVILAAAVWRWRSRRADQKGKAVELDGQANTQWQPYPHFQQYHEKDTDGQLVELPSSQPPAELDANGYR